MRIEKTVFISYRRTNFPWALNVYHNLSAHGFDVFQDVSGIASGDFERVILENIRSRAHFLVLLTPSALATSDDPEDWLRREIEAALAAERNIIPLLLEGFDFSSPDIATKLTGELAVLQHYNALEIPMEYFDDAMRRLREWLNVPLEAVLHPVSADARRATQQQQRVAGTTSPVQASDLATQYQFEQAYAAEPSDMMSIVALTKPIADAPLFSNAEQEIFESLPPHQQAVMKVRAMKQRELLLTAVMTNLMNKARR
jgi:hypothetical protein